MSVENPELRGSRHDLSHDEIEELIWDSNHGRGAGYMACAVRPAKLAGKGEAAQAQPAVQAVASAEFG